MNNQRGEVVTGVLVVIMVGMMIFGMFSMNGGRGDHKGDTKSDQQDHSETGQHNMHH